jgi:hypothetical protein
LFCTLASAAVALGFYEPLTAALISSLGVSGGYAGACVLFGLFVISLTVLRAAADNLIRGNVHVPPWLDWAGGGVCGFVNAQVTVGILILAISSLPLTGTILQYERYSRVEGEKDGDRALLAERPLWTRPVEMTVGLFNLMSSGSLRGSTEFVSVYPDFADAAWFRSNTVQLGSPPVPQRDKRTGDGFKSGVSVESWWWQDKPLSVRYRAGVPTEKEPNPPYEALSTPFKAQSGHKLLGIRLQLAPSAADRVKLNVRHLFRPTMIRLVGHVGDTPEHAVPIVLAGADDRIGGAPRLVDYDNNFALESEAKFDAFFEVPDGFTPRFVEYRSFARAAVTGEPAAAAPDSLRLATPEEARAAGSGEARSFQAIASNSRADFTFPIDLSLSGIRRLGSDVEVEGKKLKRGRVYGDVTALTPRDDADKGEGFLAPDNLRVVHVRWKPNEARSLAGQVINFAAQLNQYEAVDDRGDTYRLAGYYGLIKRNNNQFIELFFHGDPAEPGYNSMLDFKSLDRQEVYNGEESEVGLVFLVRPGVTIVRIKNQSGDGQDIEIKVGN